MDTLVHHLLSRSARCFPTRPCLVAGVDELSYWATWRLVQAASAGLKSLGLQPGERVGIYLPAGKEQALAIFATSAADGVFVPIHESRTSHQLDHIVSDCQPAVLITDHGKWNSLQSQAHARAWPSVRQVVLVGENSNATTPHAGQVGWSWLLQGHAADHEAADSPQRIDRDLAAILYTSGSTGPPKGVMLSHANIVAGASIVSSYLKINSQDRLLAILPFSFDAGLNQLTTAIQQGGATVIMSFLFAKQIVAALRKHRVTGLAGVPTLWSLLAESPAFRAQTFPDLRYITNTGGVLPRSTLETLRHTLPDTDIYLMYGLTEAFRSTYLPPSQLAKRPNSIGKAIPNTEIMVVNEQGQLCQPGEVGELVHRGPTVCLGYWDNPEATRDVLRPDPCSRPGQPAADLVCYSGDFVWADQHGYLYFVGRRDHQIKTSGFRVSPNEVEAVLLQCELVRHAAVVGVADERLGQRIEASIVLNTVDAANRPDPLSDGSPGPAAESESIRADWSHASLEKVKQVVARDLPPYMIPQRWRITTTLPWTASGKVDYAKLERIHKMESSDNVMHDPHRK